MRAATRDIAMPAPNVVAWGNLLVAIALLNGGNLLLDSVTKDAGRSDPGIALELFLSPVFILAIASLGCAFLFYVRSLARLPLAVAYPVMVGLSMIIVAVANYWWLGAPLEAPQLLGILILFLGIVLISTTSRSS